MCSPPDYFRVRHIIIALLHQRLRESWRQEARQSHRECAQKENLLGGERDEENIPGSKYLPGLMPGFPILGKVLIVKQTENP